MLFLNNTMAEFSKYVFDMIVVQISVPSGNPCQAKVECEYRDRSWIVPPDRINATEFPKEGGIEIIEPLASLLQSLRNDEFIMTVSDGKQELAEFEFKLPEYLYHNIKNLRDGFYFVRFDLVDESPGKKNNDKQGANLGCIEVMFKLTPVCNTISAPSFPDPKCPNLCNKIKEEDVLFLVGRPNKLFPCPNKNPIFKDDKAFGKLDLKNLKLYHGVQVGKIPDLPNASCSINFERFQKKQAELQRPFIKASEKDQSSGQAGVTGNCVRLPLAESDDEECELGEEEICCPHEPQQRGYNIPVPSYEYIKSLKSRCCPICRYDLKYLPALATCPRCCFKPEPTGVKEPKPQKIKKKHICSEFEEERKSLCGDDLPEVSGEPTCRCRCTFRGVCAYCRVRQACNINTKMKSFFTIQPKNTCQWALDNQNDAHISSSSTFSEDSQPRLAKIFSELQTIYNLKKVKCENYREKAGIDCKKQGTVIKKKKDFSVTLDKSSPCKDIKKIRDDMKKKKIFKKQMRIKKKNKKRSKCHFRVPKAPIPKCGQCNPIGCLPCAKPFKNKCGNKYFDYCCFRGVSAPRRDDHGQCSKPPHKVPCDMGWLWNRNKPHRGWKPGYISKKVKNLMDYFLLDFPADTLPVSRYCNYSVPKKPKLEKVEQQTTLEIEKKNKDYLITFRPLKDRETLKTAVDPFVPMKPIKVRITEDPLVSRIRSVKECMFAKGFRKCICKQPAVRCYCRSFAEKNLMLKELQQLCQKYKVENGCHCIVLDDDCDKENDEYCFGITPPAGIVKYHKFDRPDYRQAMTQYNNTDYTPVPVMGEYKQKNKYEQILQQTIKAAVKAEEEKMKPLFKKPEKNPTGKRKGKKGASASGKSKAGDKGAGGDGPPAASSPEARKAALLERFAKHKKLNQLVGPDGKIKMDAYLTMKPMLKGKAAAVARTRRLRSLLEEIPLPFEVFSHRDRAFNSNMPCSPCGPCYPYGPRNLGGPCGFC